MLWTIKLFIRITRFSESVLCSQMKTLQKLNEKVSHWFFFFKYFLIFADDVQAIHRDRPLPSSNTGPATSTDLPYTSSVLKDITADADICKCEPCKCESWSNNCGMCTANDSAATSHTNTTSQVNPSTILPSPAAPSTCNVSSPQAPEPPPAATCCASPAKTSCCSQSDYVQSPTAHSDCCVTVCLKSLGSLRQSINSSCCSGNPHVNKVLTFQIMDLPLVQSSRSKGKCCQDSNS